MHGADAWSNGALVPRPVLRIPARGALDVLAESTDARRSTVRFCGEADAATADLIRAALHHELTVGHRFLRLDLSRLTFLDCSTIREILRAHHVFRAARGTLVLTGCTPVVRRMLSLTHLKDALFVGDGNVCRTGQYEGGRADDHRRGTGSQRPAYRHLRSVDTGTAL